MPLTSDHPPIGAADDITMSANDAATLSTGLEPDGKLIDILANDTDPDEGDASHFWLLDWTQPVDEQGNPVGTLAITATADGRQALSFFSDDPNLQVGTHTITFSYRVADQWASESDSSTWPYSVSQPTTVTITVTGNSIPGETICGGHRPDSIAGDGGNDLLFGGSGKDTLVGAAGADTLVGGDGKDALSGGDGNDRLFGGGKDCHCDHHDDDDHGSGSNWGWSWNWGHGSDGDGGPDTLDGGRGDDTLSGGHGPDRFVLGDGFGHDLITDFDPHNDKLVVDHNMWGSWSSVQANAVQVGHDVVITSIDGLNSVTLHDVMLKSLRQSDFLFT